MGYGHSFSVGRSIQSCNAFLGDQRINASYYWVVQILRFNEAYVTNILVGKKTASIRSNVRGLMSDSIIPFTANGRRFAMARIKEIRPVRFQELSEEDAKRDGFETL